MAQVPVYRPQVGPSGLPGVRQGSQAPAVIPVGEFNARQTQQLGANIMSGGQQLAQIQIQLQEEANQLRVDDALNKAKEVALKYTYDQNLGFMNQRGEAALSRQSGKPLSDEYAETLDKEMQAIGDGLGNDRQREVFNAYRNRMLGQFRESVMRHEANEFGQYRASVRQGTIENRTRDIALNYNNTQLIDENIQSIRAAVWDLGQLQGWSAEEVESRQRSATSVAHRSALAAALDRGDVAYASMYLKKNLNQMEADDIVRVQKVLTEVSNGQIANRAATSVIKNMGPAYAPSELDRLSNLTLAEIQEQPWFDRLDGAKVQAESGGRRYDSSGNLLQGPEVRGQGTAKGEHQVMDATNKDPGYGVVPARDNSPEERARVGRDYMAAMLREYDFDYAKALAAYNAGPGNVNNAIKAAEKAGDPDWMKFLPKPKETVPYVQKILAEFNAGLGAPPKPTLSAVQDRIRQEIGDDNPKALDLALKAGEAMYKAAEKDAKDRSDQALDVVYKALYANGGRMDQLPAHLIASVTGDKLSSVRSFAESMIKNEGAAHQPGVWAQVMSMADQELAQMSPAQFYQQFRPYLDDSHLEKGYALIEKAQKKMSEDPARTYLTSQAEMLKNTAMSAGIIPWDGKPNKSQIKDYAAFLQEGERRIQEFERVDLEGKRKATREELTKIIDTMVIDKVYSPNPIWWDSEVPLWNLDDESQEGAYVKVGKEEITLSRIPDEQRTLIITELRRTGEFPTAQRVAEMWVKAGKPMTLEDARR